MTYLPGATNYNLDLLQAKINGATASSFQAFNGNIGTVSQELIWEQGGLYTYLTTETELFISSSSASDTSPVLISGMDGNYELKEQLAVLDGQNQVSIGNFFRVFTMIHVGPDIHVGDIYCAESDTLTGGVPNDTTKIKERIMAGDGLSHSARATVPVGKTLYIDRLFGFTGKNKDMNMFLYFRLFGSNYFKKGVQIGIYENAIQLVSEGLVAFSEKIDIEIRAVSENPNTPVGATMIFYVLDNLT